MKRSNKTPTALAGENRLCGVPAETRTRNPLLRRQVVSFRLRLGLGIVGATKHNKRYHALPSSPILIASPSGGSSNGYVPSPACTYAVRFLGIVPISFEATLCTEWGNGNCKAYSRPRSRFRLCPQGTP